MWSKAYLKQARSDWKTYEIVTRNACEACHGLHYLQMTTEKLGKAALLESGNKIEDVKTTHIAFVRFLQVIARNPNIQKSLQMNARQLKEHIDEILPLAHKIQSLCPAHSNNGPNAEYPWQLATGEVKWPAQHVFQEETELSGSKGRKLLILIKQILENFDSLFN